MAPTCVGAIFFYLCRKFIPYGWRAKSFIKTINFYKTEKVSKYND